MEPSNANSDLSAIAPSAVRGGYLGALSYALFVPVSILLGKNIAALIVALLVWIMLIWLMERYRLGPDYKAKGHAEYLFLRGQGYAPFFFGFHWALVAYLFIAVAGVAPSFGFGAALFTALAVGRFCQATWISHKLRSAS